MTIEQKSGQKTTARGIDVSHYQGAVDWRAVKGAGICFAFAKATDGIAERDPCFGSNWREMKEAGIVRGAYHFFRAAQDATGQAQHFAQRLQQVTLEAGDLPPVLDVEITDGVDNQVLVDRVRTWLDAIEQELGRRPLIYTDHAFWSAHMTDRFGHYPLWIAAYEVDRPPLPEGWENWIFWQFSQKGQMSGVQGDVDLDRFNGSRDDLGAFLQSPGKWTATETAPETAATKTRTFTVQPRDSLDGIAARYGVTGAELAKTNKIDDPNRIAVGQVLKIPS